MTQLNDTFTIDGVQRTGDGYLTAFARVARTGIQVYKGHELGRPDLAEVRVYRPPEEVFHADALKSFAHRPLTLRHPPVPVTAKNWKKFAGGQTGDEVVRDGEFVRVPMVMMDAAIIDAYEKDGIKELSMGYSTDIKWRTGVTDSGEEYDAVQTAIRANHLAVVPVARGGDQLRIGDEDDIDDAWSEEARAAALEARRTKSKHPDSVSHEGKTYHATGKTGRNFKTGEHSAEYRHYGESGNEDERVWRTKSGKIVRDSTEGEYNMKLVIDGVPVSVADDQSGAIIERHIASLVGQIKTVTDSFEDFKKKSKTTEEADKEKKAACDAKDGEIAVLNQKLKDAEVTPEKLDVMVKDRLAVIDAAKSLLGDKYVFDGKTVATIRKDAVKVKLGDSADAMPEAAIDGAFVALTKDAKSVTADRQIGDAMRHRPHSQTQVTDERNNAYNEMIKNLENAHKTKVA